MSQTDTPSAVVADISVVIPAFERADLLGRALDSALAQREVNVEIVVCDDSCSAAITTALEARGASAADVRLIPGARTGNAVDNWNLGLDAATADIKVLLHQDDEFGDSGYLRNCVDALARPGVIAGIARARMIGVARPSRHGVTRWVGSTPAGVALLPLINWIGHTAAFPFKGAHRFDPAFKWLVDVDFYSRVLSAGRVARIAGPGVRCLGHQDGSISDSLDIASLWPAELALWAAKAPDRLPSGRARAFAAIVEAREWARRRGL